MKSTTQEPHFVPMSGSELQTPADQPTKTFCVRAVMRTLTDSFLCVEAQSQEDALRLAKQSKPELWGTWDDRLEELVVYDVLELSEEETREATSSEGRLQS